MNSLYLAASADPVFTLFAGLILLILLFWFFASEKDRIRRNVGSVVIGAVVIFSIVTILSPSDWGQVLTGKKSVSEAHNIRKGIDIAGGTSFILQVHGKDDQDVVDVQAMNEVKKVIEKRLAEIKFPDASVTLQVDKARVEVQISDINEDQVETIRKTLTDVAVLEIYQYSHDTRELVFNHTNPTTGDVDLEGLKEDLEPGQKVFPSRQKDIEGNVINSYVVVEGPKPEIVGNDVKRASPDYRSGTVVRIKLTSEGGRKNEAFTSRMEKGVDRIAIIFDGICISSPVQAADKLGDEFVITGMDNIEECKRLANSMMNPLQNKPEIKQARNISATLGESTVQQGIKAGIAGLALTLVFVLIYYKWAGLIALFGLAVNILVIFGSMALVEATLTLPGIAGVILTIGVAVDANVLIYERLREERELGKSFVDALRVAYEKAFSAIIDANITTLITAIILFIMATGSVQGFAVTLTIGILGTLLAALVCTRILFWYGGDYGVIKDVKFLNLIPKKSIDFLSKSKLSLGFSTILVIASIVIIGTQGKSSLGVEFTGGMQFEYEVREEVTKGENGITQPKLQKTLSELNLTKEAKGQIADPPGQKIITVTFADSLEDKATIDSAVRALHPDLQEKNEDGSYKIADNANKISASMGAEFLQNSLIALGLGLLGIIIYITLRFEFSFAVGAFFALSHDIIAVLGFLMIMGDELSMIHVGAFLTIAGYSINDTIVVFDRIRENLRYSESSIKEVMNAAISSTLSRTILTSVTTFVAVLVLFVFGGTALSDFALTIMIGVIVGTYSSIFVAAPIVWYFSKLRNNDLRKEIIEAEEAGKEKEADDEEPDFGDEEPAKAN